jgi:hypothetical protein
VYLLAAMVWGDSSPAWLPVAAVAAALASLTLPAAYVGASYRVRGQFHRIAVNDIVSNLVGLVTIVAGAYFWGLPGLVIGAFLGLPVALLMGREWLFPPGWRQVNPRYIWGNVSFSGILLLSSVLSQLSLTVDVVVLRHMLPDEDARLGFYAVSASVANIIYGLMAAMADVQGLRLLRAYGQGESSGGAAKLSERMEFYMARDGFITVLACSAAAVGMGVLVPLVFTKYTPVLSILGVFLLGMIILRWKTYPALYLNVSRKTIWVIVGSALAVATIFAHMLVVTFHFGGSLGAYSLVAVISHLAPAVVTIVAAFVLSGHRGSLPRLVGKLLAAHVPTVLFGLLWLVPVQWQGPAYVAAGLIVPLLCIVTFRALFPGVLYTVWEAMMSAGLRKVLGFIGRGAKGRTLAPARRGRLNRQCARPPDGRGGRPACLEGFGLGGAMPG